MRIDIYRGNDRKTGAEIAVKYKLYQNVNSWQMKGIYREFLQGNLNHLTTILVAVADGLPVASAVVFEYKDGDHYSVPYYYDFQVFVRKKHRRKGIASALYECAMKTERRTKPLLMGADHSQKAYRFYKKIKERPWESMEQDIDDAVTIEVELREKVSKE